MHDNAKAGTFNALITASDNGSSPHHQVEMQSLFNLPKHFEFDTTYRYVSALPAQTSMPAGPIVGDYSSFDVAFWLARPTTILNCPSSARTCFRIITLNSAVTMARW